MPTNLCYLHFPVIFCVIFLYKLCSFYSLPYIIPCQNTPFILYVNIVMLQIAVMSVYIVCMHYAVITYSNPSMCLVCCYGNPLYLSKEPCIVKQPEWLPIGLEYLAYMHIATVVTLLYKLYTVHFIYLVCTYDSNLMQQTIWKRDFNITR